jgi:hypothetical protein
MTNIVNHLYKVTNLTTGKVVTLGSILEISMHTGYGAGFLSTRIRPHRGDGVYRLDHWEIEDVVVYHCKPKESTPSEELSRAGSASTSA